MKKAFTMIELIFVIVILGILAAVALPKFLGVAKQAHEANLKQFVGTLNRTVGPTLWSKSLTDGNNGSIKSFTSAKQYINIPKEIGQDFSFSNCGASGSTLSPLVDSNTSITGDKYGIYCRDGNSTTAPAFALIDETTNKCISGQCSAFTVNGSTVTAN